MRNIIVLNRKGIQIVAGTVTEVDETAEMVIICNSDSTQKLALQCEDGQIQKMRIKAGSRVVASIKPNVQTIAMAEGVANDTMPAVDMYMLRYTGSFDFEQKGTEPEQHVFCGDIKEVKDAENGLLIKIQWLRRHEPEVRWLYYAKPEKKETMLKLTGEQVVFVAGEKVNIHEMEVYRLQKIGLF